MLAEERRFQIREILASQRTVTASELCDRLRVTAATIRRDLATLEKDGVLVRSHGGAVSRMSSTNFQPSYDALLRSNSEEKRQIARSAEPFLLDGDTIFLEGSTTVFELARLLVHRHRLTVVTNSPSIVCELQRSPGVTVLSTGRKILFISPGSGRNAPCRRYGWIRPFSASAPLIPTTASQPPATRKRKSRKWSAKRPRCVSRWPITENSANNVLLMWAR